MAFVVREYVEDSGRIPFRDWLTELDKATRARVQARILRFETGNLGDHKDVGAGVLEARLDFGPGYRVYFGRKGRELVLLLLGGDQAGAGVLVEVPEGEQGMTKRSRDWNQGLAEDLQDPEFARQFLTAAVEEGVPLKLALAKVIRATGVKEFSETVGMPSPNVLRAINPKHNPTQETLERLLRPFGLRIGLAQIKQRRKGRAA